MPAAHSLVAVTFPAAAIVQKDRTFSFDTFIAGFVRPDGFDR